MSHSSPRTDPSFAQMLAEGEVAERVFLLNVHLLQSVLAGYVLR